MYQITAPPGIMPISLRIMIAIIFLSLGTVLWFGLDVVDTQFFRRIFCFFSVDFLKLVVFCFQEKRFGGIRKVCAHICMSEMYWHAAI